MELLTRIALIIFVSAVILLAIIMGGLRLAISNIDYFKSEIEYLLERDVSEGIVFTGVSGEVRRFNPILSIENVSINLPDRSQPLFIDRLTVEFDFWASLKEETPVVLEIFGQLEKLELTRDESGRWWSHELEIGAGDRKNLVPDLVGSLAFVPRYLKLDLRRLILRDEKNATTHLVERVAAKIDHRHGQYFAQLSAALPDALGQGVLIKSAVDPDQSVFYVNASNLRLPAVAELLNLETWGLKDGELDGEVWLNLSGNRIAAINGDLMLKRGLLQVTAEKVPVAVDYRARFTAINRRTNWRITSDIMRLRVDNQTTPGFRAQLVVSDESSQPRISAWINRLQISSLPAIAGQWLPTNVSQQIAQGSLQGLLRDVMFSIDLQRPEEFKLGAHAVGISSKAFGDFPGTTSLDADFLIGQKKLGFKLYGKNVSLDFADFFRAPLEFDSLSLEANARRTESGEIALAVNRFEAQNQDASVSGRIWIEVDQYERPFMYLRANFIDADASSAGKYMPVKLLPAKTLQWLDRGIKGGHAPEGELQYHGRLIGFEKLAKERSGEFFVDFPVENAEVFFAPGWLNAKNGNGRVLFHNTGVEFELDQASYEKLDNARARGLIADFDRAVLELDIESDMSAADAVRIWIDSPVGQRYREVMSNVEGLGGDINAKIRIRLPLHSGNDEQQVLVNVDFKNAIARARNWGLDLSQIKGQLQVTQNEVFANQINAKFFGDPVRISINSETPGGDTVVNVKGVVESANLLKRLPDRIAQYVSGKSDWQIGLVIAPETAPDQQPYLQISATSRLLDTQISLPQPFAKSGADSSRLAADIEFFPRQIRFATDLGSDIRSRGNLLLVNEQDFELDSLEIAFTEELEPLSRRGLILHGFTEEISVDEWITVFKGSGVTSPALLKAANLSSNRVNAFNQIFENARIDIRQIDDQRFLGEIQSSTARGRFKVPNQISAKTPLVVNLEYLRLDKPEQEADYSALRPSDLVDFRLSSEALVYHDMLFNDVMIEARQADNKLHVDNFSLRRDEIKLSSKAKWEYDPGTDSHVSSVNLNLEGPELGQSIAGLGFGDSMTDGTIEFNGDFTWPAPLPDFDLEKFKGNASLKIKDGVLNNVDPGSGRLVGLLSLSALPRRLSLDFSDVVIEGMEFSEISGTYRVSDGTLYTQDTRMEGPAAKIKISGKTGIGARNYDQLIRVTPKIRQTLPLIGAVSAGSSVGWGLLLLQNLFKKAIDDAVEVEYKVTGSWDDPQIELIKAVDENQRELPKIDK